MVLAWIVLFLLILVNAIYVAAEFATVSVRRSRIGQLAEDGNRLAKRLLPIIENPAALDRYIAACQIGITWSSLVVGAFSQATLAASYAYVLAGWRGLDYATAFSITSVIVLVLMTTLQVVLGELVPKSVALQYPSQVAVAMVVPMEVSLRLYSWFLKILNGSGLAILKLFGVSHATHQHVHSPEEIEFLMAESQRGGLIELDEHQRLRKALRLASRPVRQLMVPTRLMVSIPVDAPVETIRRVLAEHIYTRMPVHDKSPDDIVGILHTKDLIAELARTGVVPPVRSVMRPIVTVSEHASAGNLLDILRNRKAHQALVVGEFGVRGLVTFGDVLSELLGGISALGRVGQPPPARLDDNSFRVPGLMRVEDAAEWLGVTWRSEAVTLGGLLTRAFGYAPSAGERVTIQGVEFDIEQVAGPTISSVLARRLPPQPEVRA